MRIFTVLVAASLLTLSGCFANPTPHPTTGADAPNSAADTTADGGGGTQDTTTAGDTLSGPDVPVLTDTWTSEADAVADMVATPDGAADGGADVAGDAPEEVTKPDVAGGDSAAGDASQDGGPMEDASGADAEKETAGDVTASPDAPFDASPDGPPLHVGPWGVAENGGDAVWNPGETITISVTLSSDEDFSNYPAAVLSDDQDLVTYSIAQFDFFAIFADSPMEASWQVTADATIPMATVVTFTAYASTLSCGQGNGVCPPYEPLTFALTIGEALPPN